MSPYDALLNDEEKYRFDERLAILTQGRKETPQQVDIAYADVVRFRVEIAQSTTIADSGSGTC